LSQFRASRTDFPPSGLRGNFLSSTTTTWEKFGMISVLRVLCALFFFSLAPKLPSQLGLVSVASAQETANVWVNTRSGVYHCPGTRYYGNTKSGELIPEAARELREIDPPTARAAERE
jgi:hypothetical protein